MRTARYARCESGQGLVEYALILVLVAGLGLLSLNLMGVSLQDVYQKLVDVFSGTSGQGGGAQSACKNYYQSGFDEALDGWDDIQSKFWRGKWDVQDGQLVGSKLGAILYGGLDEKDYSVSLNGATLTPTSANNPTYQGFGLIFRAETVKGNLNGYMFEVEKKNKNDPGTIYFSQFINGVQIKPALASAPVPSKFDWSNPGSMSVSAVGDTFTAYLNGQPILTASDDLYASGQAGAAVNNGSILRLDGFSIDSPECQEQ